MILIIFCDFCVRKNIVIWNLIKLILMYTFQITTICNFYWLIIHDIKVENSVSISVSKENGSTKKTERSMFKTDLSTELCESSLYEIVGEKE